MEYLTDLDRSISEKLLGVEYFNLETSPCRSTLVINASKPGIEAFLKQYGHLENPPPSISFEQWTRPQRSEYSRFIEDNPDALPTDPTPYKAYPNNTYPTPESNNVHLTLSIRFLKNDSEKAILAVGYQHTKDILPVLTVNRKGWKKFLYILNCLLHKRWWFYVTPLRDAGWEEHLPFFLTTPYPGDPEEHVFRALECIRLKIAKVIFLGGLTSISQEKKEDGSVVHRASGNMFGNRAGCLMFSKWMHDFAASKEVSQDILNQWDDDFYKIRKGPSWFHLRKTCLDAPYPVLSFGTQVDRSPTEESCNFYIFGNPWGFEELSRLMEAPIFCVDHRLFTVRSLKNRFGGEITKNISIPEGVVLLREWSIAHGGGDPGSGRDVETEKPDPIDPKEISADKFVNERIYYEANGRKNQEPPVEYLTSLDRSIYEKLLKVEYFNLETSYRRSTLVINASKSGIEAFLKEYGGLEIPPPSISFEQSSRPQRAWQSRSIEDNPDSLPMDSSPYKAYPCLARNHLHPMLSIRFLENDSEKAILAVGYRRMKNILPVLTVNKKGWKKFLDILDCLLHKRYWFYVTAPRDASWERLPFFLTVPYPGDPEERPFKALECIRLEPEKFIYLYTPVCMGREKDSSAKFWAEGSIESNTAGLLMFSKWMHDFAISKEVSQDILNRWNSSAKSRCTEEAGEPSPYWFHLRKTCLDSSRPVLAFGTQTDGSLDFYIFGNSLGFEELSRLTETSPFRRGYNKVFERSPKECFDEQTIKHISIPEGIVLLRSWEIEEGTLFNRACNPDGTPNVFAIKEERDPKEVAARKFINKRLYYGSND